MQRIYVTFLLLMGSLMQGFAQDTHYTTTQSQAAGTTTGGNISTFFNAGQASVSTFVETNYRNHAAGFVATQTTYKPREIDSLVLRSIYNFSNGTNWTRKDFWLDPSPASTIDTWQNVTVVGDRVATLDLSANQLGDTIPYTLQRLDNLTELYLQDNNLTGIPDVTDLQLTILDVKNNRLFFNDLEPLVAAGFSTFEYIPQQQFGSASTQELNPGTAQTLTFNVDLGAGTVYQWFRNGTEIPNATAASYTFSPTTVDAGTYRLEATHPNVPGLTLVSANITATITNLSVDIDALTAIYNALGGANWTTRTNWTQNQDITTWFGITTNSSLRVTGINLPNNNLTGVIPANILQLEALTTLNVSNNNITNLVALTGLTNLTSVNISNNRLLFPQIIPNVGVTGITYQPQKAFGTPDTIRVLLTQEATFDVLANLTTTGNTYRWRFQPALTDAATDLTDEGSDAQVFTLNNIEFTDRGFYTLSVRNASAPALTLVSNPIFLNVINEYPVNLRDSAALVSMYQALNGSGWSRRANWLTDSLKKWQGVTLLRGNVSQFDLSSNNVRGNFPALAGDQLNSLTNLNLSGNVGVNLPASFFSMSSLATLNLSNMEVSAIPNATGLGNLTNLDVSNNKLQFGDLQPFIERSNFTFNYSPQEKLGTVQNLLVNEGENININYTLEGTGMTYQWFKDGSGIAGATAANYQKEFNVNDNGIYFLEVRHPQLTALVLSSNTVSYTMRNSVADSLALRRLYLSNGGEQWTRKANWLSELPVAEWEGVTYQNGKVRTLTLSDNNLTGKIAAFTGYELSELTSLNLASNNLEQIPSLTNLSRLTSLEVANNFLQFGSLEPNIAVATFSYTPQKELFTDVDSIRELGRASTISRSISGANNVYKWYKTIDGVRSEYPTTTNVITFDPIAFADEGDFDIEVTNTAVEGLTLSTAPITLFVASRERDEKVLQALFDQLGGASWTGVAANWRESPLTQPEITFNALGTRVAGINLSGKGLTGRVPNVLRTMTDLVSINLSNNNLTFVPALTQTMTGLTTLNVENNRLQFQSIQNNLDVTNYTFAPQGNLSENTLVRQPQGSKVTLQAVSTGSNLTYQWFFKANAGAVETSIPTAIAPTFEIPVLEYENMGLYFCRVSNVATSLRSTGFNLRTGEFLVQATADITGTVTNVDGQLEDGRRAVLYRIAPVGTPYPPVDTSLIVDNKYLFDDIVLNDFIIRVAPSADDEDTYVATYALTAVTWDAAKKIELRRDVEQNTELQFTPEKLPINPDAGVVTGFIDLEEDDFPELFSNTTGRTQGRRRSANVGVSFNRLRSTIRGADDRIFDLVAYVLSDENGNFEVANLPDGTYKVNFDFPGVPTDPTSFVEFDLGSGGIVDNNKIKIAADVQRTGIVVSKIEETGIRNAPIDVVQVYPVPAVSNVTLKYNVRYNFDRNLHLEVLDLNGKILRNIPLQHSLGMNEVIIPMEELNAGVYLIAIKDSDNALIRSTRVLKK